MPSDAQREEQLFTEALAFPERLRAAFLRERCGDDQQLRADIEALLAQHEAADAFETALSRSFADAFNLGAFDPQSEDLVGTAIGPYHIVERIGEGGTGVVYRAVQTEPIHRTVALKAIKPGMDTREVLTRFAAERQTLAMLDHPGIARVIEAGATARGRPYFVMELVHGEPVTTCCDTHRLSLVQRIELLRQICAAVQHAHQNGIIHRDLKPSNILVTIRPDAVAAPPIVKIIDFGIAKAVRVDSAPPFVTQHAQFLGTPGYMSPEQAAGKLDLDTRSDVYSLGALLFELLTGDPPHSSRSWLDHGLDELRRHIREDRVPAPSTWLTSLDSARLARAAAARATTPARLLAALRGELDWITQRCLEIPRDRRYPTASALAEDLRRHLEHEPVAAAAPSRLYEFKKSLRRHRLAYAAAATLVLTLAAATTLSLRLAHRTRLAETATAKEAAAHAALASFLQTDLLAQASPDRQPDRDIRLRTVLDNAAARIGNRFADQPLVEAAIRTTIARTYVSLGEYATALPHHRRAFELRRQHGGLHFPDTFAAFNATLNTLRRLARFDEAEHLGDLHLPALLAAHGPLAPESLAARFGLATMHLQRGRRDEARAQLTAVHADQQTLLGPDHPDTLRTLANLATAHDLTESHAEAERLGRELLTRRERSLGPDHPDTVNARENLLDSLLRRDDLTGADRLLTAVLAARERIQGPDHPRTLSTLQNLGSVRHLQGRYEEAIALLQRARNGYIATLGPDHPAGLMPLFNLGRACLALDRPAEAEPLLRECLQRRERALGAEHSQTTDTLTILAQTLGQLDRSAEADALFQRALDIRRRQHGEDSSRYRETLERYRAFTAATAP